MDQVLKRRGWGAVGSIGLSMLAAGLVVVGLFVSFAAPRLPGRPLWSAIGFCVLLLNLFGGFLAARAIARRTGVIWAVAGLAMNAASFLCLCGVTCLILFGSSSAPGQSFTLPSGKQIRITFVGPVSFPQDKPAFVMNCDTDISIENMPELQKEVDEIWDSFRKDVEAAHMTNAVIRMNHNEGTGIITRGNGCGFMFKKEDDGRWYRVTDEKQK